MKCVICKHGETKAGRARLLFNREGREYVVHNVPADICNNCGEEYFSEEAIAALEKSFDTSTRLETPVEARHFIIPPALLQQYPTTY